MSDREKYVQNYKNDKFEEIMVYYRRKCVLENIDKYTHTRILEVGCGLQPLFTSGVAYEKMTIVEPAVVFCKNAQELYNAGRYATVKIIPKELQLAGDELKEEKWDFIVVSSLLHEIDNKEEFLEAIHEIANEESVIHFNVPNARSFHRLLAYETGLIDTLDAVSKKMKAFDRRRIYTTESLQEDMFKAGFKVMESGSYFLKPFTHDQMQMMLDDNIISQDILEGLNRMTKYMPDLGSEIYVNVQKSGKLR